MTRQTITILAIGSSLALILAIGSVAQEKPAAPAAGMQNHCKTTMEHKAAMAAETKAQDAALTEMIAKMNRTSGAEQATLMAAVLTRMVEERVARNVHMAAMDHETMQHMMKHMTVDKDSMAHCPMMKDMEDKKGMAGMKRMDGK